MCCFSRPVRHVSQTHIYARPLPGGRQALAYSMNVNLSEETAMVLPLPVALDRGDDALQFIDLSACPSFFSDLSSLFPEIMLQAKRGGLALSPSRNRPKLKVHAVGDFEASYVPTPRDFDRLDERFRLPPRVFDTLPQYQHYGFAVFKLAPKKKHFWGFLSPSSSKDQTIHPMAFVFPRQNEQELFFPTVHVHDGELHPEADFDHSLYCQLPADLASLLAARWERSFQPIGKAILNASHFIDDSAHAYRLTLLGRQKNQDTWLRYGDLHEEAFIGDGFFLRMSSSDPWVLDSLNRWLPETQKLSPDAFLAERKKLRAFLYEKITSIVQANRSNLNVQPYSLELTALRAFGDGSIKNPELPWFSAVTEGSPCNLRVYLPDVHAQAFRTAQDLIVSCATPPSPSHAQRLAHDLKALGDAFLNM